jgi:hypothetical protein
MIVNSSIEPIYYILPLTGFIIGLFGSVLGGGGGFFFLPVLTLIIGVPAQIAVITSLVATLPICAVGALMHYRKGNVDAGKGFLLAIAGIVGAFTGSYVANIIKPEQLETAFGVYSVLIALFLGVNTWKKRTKNKNADIGSESTGKFFLQKSKGSVYGFFAGVITGTFGTSGTAPVLAGLFSMNLPVKVVVGTSLMVVLANTFFAVGAHFLIGQIDMTLVYFLTSGSVIGALLGPVIVTKVKTDHLESSIKYLYAAVMGVIGILMIVA